MNNVVNLNERRLAKADEKFSHRVVLPRAEVDLLLKIAEARAIVDAKENASA